MGFSVLFGVDLGMELGQLCHNALLMPSADGLALGRRSATVSRPGPQQL